MFYGNKFDILIIENFILEKEKQTRNIFLITQVNLNSIRIIS